MEYLSVAFELAHSRGALAKFLSIVRVNSESKQVGQ